MLFYPKSMVEAHPIPLSENSLAPTILTIFPPNPPCRLGEFILFVMVEEDIQLEIRN